MRLASPAGRPRPRPPNASSPSRHGSLSQLPVGRSPGCIAALSPNARSPHPTEIAQVMTPARDLTSCRRKIDSLPRSAIILSVWRTLNGALDLRRSERLRASSCFGTVWDVVLELSQWGFERQAYEPRPAQIRHAGTLPVPAAFSAGGNRVVLRFVSFRTQHPGIRRGLLPIACGLVAFWLAPSLVLRADEPAAARRASDPTTRRRGGCRRGSGRCRCGAG